MEEKPLFCGVIVYRERGAYLRRLEQYEKAEASYDEAFKINPDDVPLLIGRSQVCAEVVKPEQAYADAQLALKLDPINMLATNVQAQAMYTMTDFEKSLVMNYRGIRKRRQPPYFANGISQATETIQDCIGVNAGDVMLDFLPLIKENEIIREQAQKVPVSLHKCRIPQMIQKRKMTQMEARNDMILARVLAMKYLGPMAYDKFFLQELLEDPRLESANSLGSKELRAIVKEALASLTKRQDMLRAQRPYYSIKLAEKAKSHYQNKYKEATLVKEREILKNIAQKYIVKIYNSLRGRRINELMRHASQMQTFLDTKTPRNLPEKDKYIDKLYRIIGEAYLCQHRLSYHLDEGQNRRRVAFLMGIPVGRAKTYDDVLSNYPTRFSDINKAVKDTLVVLDMCENSAQRCFLYYEMSRLVCAQKNYALSKFYARRCQREAQHLQSETWWLNGCFALISGDMQQGNETDIRVAVEQALEFAKKVLDKEQVTAFLSKCLEMVSEPAIADDTRPVLKRQQQILSVMEEPYLVEQKVLFKRMSTVPAGRRFKVLPQKLIATQAQAERTMYKQRGLTVVPGFPVALRKPPRTRVLGHQLFDL